jgi:hypothetical protein
MNIRKEIYDFAEDADKPILNWLFDHYQWDSQWRFVAKCTMQRYGHRSYECNRVWSPTIEGVAIYRQLKDT